MDVTFLKAYMYHQNIQNLHPTLFKKINDLCISSNFTGQLQKQEFLELFTNNLFSQAKSDPLSEPPTLIEIAELFEFLDEDKSGMISASNLLEMLEMTQRLKDAKFDHKIFFKQRTVTPPALQNTLYLMKQQVEQLIDSFDLAGDRLLSPDEFFNIIMFLFE